MSELYIHVGYPKTATTTLQNRLFNNIEDIYFVGKPYCKDVQELIYIFLYGDQFLYAQNKEKIFNYFRKIFQHNKKVLWSEESLLGFRIGRLAMANNAFRLLELSEELQVKCKIIFTLRNQIDWITSAFMQITTKDFSLGYSNTYYMKRYNDYINYSFEKPDHTLFQLSDYYQVISDYKTIFEDICVLSYDEFKINKNSFIVKLSQYLNTNSEEMLNILASHHDYGKTKNSSGDYYFSVFHQLVKLKKRFFPENLGLSQGKLTGKIIKRLKSISSGITIKMSDENKLKVYEYFEESNNKLLEVYGVDFNQIHKEMINKNSK